MGLAVPGMQGSIRAANESYQGIQAQILLSGYDFYDRDFARQLLNRVPRQGALSWMRAAKGYMKKRHAKRHQYYYHEEGQWFF